MKKYLDNNLEVRVIRCPAGLYLIKNLGVLQNAVASKDVAQSFLDSWAVKKKMQPIDDLDVDLYDKANAKACADCVQYCDGRCARVKNAEEKRE